MLMNRKQRRARNRKMKKQSQAKVESVEKALSEMPTKCDECDTPFDRGNKLILDN